MSALLVLSLLCLSASQAQAFDVTRRNWSFIVLGPYTYKGRVQDDTPQIFTSFKTLKECHVARDAKLSVPKSKLIRDCFDPELPSSDSFPAPWRGQP